MRTRLCCFLLFCCCFLASAPAFAWNNIGHMAAAYVAWQHLSPALRARTSALIKLNPQYASWVALLPDTATASEREMYLFMIAATWPDQIKSDYKDYPCDGQTNGNDPPAGESPDLNTGYSDPCMHKYWHFIDVRYNPDGTTPQPVAVPAPNAEQKIDAFTRALHSDESDELKSYALVWLEHLVGDIHQPLHCVSRFTADHPTGDAGGNSVVITGTYNELHAYWDDILGDSTSYGKNATGTLYTDALLGEKVGKLLPPAGVESAARSTSEAWVKESVTAAGRDVYKTPVGPEWGPYTLTSEYHDNNKRVAERRVSLAGVRLANLIKAELQ